MADAFDSDEMIARFRERAASVKRRNLAAGRRRGAAAVPQAGTARLPGLRHDRRCSGLARRRRIDPHHRPPAAGMSRRPAHPRRLDSSH
ncbi:MAG: hypothetical protein R2695_00685 [Acidimicrobiales bacterium]